MTVFGSIMLGWPLPLTVLQILWLNQVTDRFGALARAVVHSVFKRRFDVPPTAR